MENLMDKLKAISDKYDTLGEKMSDPTIHSDPQEYKKVAREHAALREVVEKYYQYRDVVNGIEEAKLILADSDDPELKELAQMDLSEMEPEKEKLEEVFPILLLPKDPNDEKNVIVEIRAGAGGDEAALFATDLYRMSTRYAEEHRWKTEVLSSNESGIGGLKEIVFILEGMGAYSLLKYESGVHRVQRVPATEASGRIHTSTATVAVLPEAEEVEIEIDTKDLRIDTFRSSGSGGQHVNTTDSAVRITHIPSGIVVSCQDEKSQHKNRDKAMKILRAKINEIAQAEAQAEEAEARRSQVGTGDRSERIRTYNFPQGRVTDHRINMTLYQLEQVLNGALDQFIDQLITYDQTEKLKKV